LRTSSFRVSCYQIVLSAQDVFYRALPNLYPELYVLTLYPISDDGCQVMAIVHMDLWSRWTNNRLSSFENKQRSFSNISYMVFFTYVNKCKDLDHLFIICGAVYASCISRNPFKALSIHVNHNECVFLKTSSSFQNAHYRDVHINL
jgi:hypothetical protein